MGIFGRSIMDQYDDILDTIKVVIPRLPANELITDFDGCLKRLLAQYAFSEIEYEQTPKTEVFSSQNVLVKIPVKENKHITEILPLEGSSAGTNTIELGYKDGFVTHVIHGINPQDPETDVRTTAFKMTQEIDNKNNAIRVQNQILEPRIREMLQTRYSSITTERENRASLEEKLKHLK